MTKVVESSFMPAPKGHPKWGGRKAGTPNRITSAAREAIELAFDNLGGVNALTEWARQNQDAFYTRVWPKVLPLQYSEGQAEPLTVVIRKLSDDPPGT